MKKGFCLLLVLVLLIAAVLPVSASAATPRMIAIFPSLYFEENTAVCGVEVNCDRLSDQISIVVILWKGNTALTQWRANGNGFLDFSDTYPISGGGTYTLTADVTINGVLQPRVSITKP